MLNDMCFDTETYKKQFEIDLSSDSMKLNEECINMSKNQEDFDDYTSATLQDLILIMNSQKD